MIMVLTLPILIDLWSLAFISVVGCTWQHFQTRKIYWLPIGYLAVGFFALAMPMKIALPVTSYWGMLFFTVMWPVWMGQDLFGYSMLGWFPTTFWAWMFDFT